MIQSQQALSSDCVLANKRSYWISYYDNISRIHWKTDTSSGASIGDHWIYKGVS